MNEFREIQLTQGQIAIVDASDFEWLSKRKWGARWAKATGSYYAITNSSGAGGLKRRTLCMHREILGITDPATFVDHKNRNTLDNRRNNLRVATRSENACNRGYRIPNSSGYKGVSWDKNAGKWRPQIMKDGKRFYLGYFCSPVEAYRVYCENSKALHGEFGNSGQ